MANGYEQFFKKAKASAGAPKVRSWNTADGEQRVSEDLEQNRFVLDQPQNDRITKSERSRTELIKELRRRVQKRRIRKVRKFPKSILIISILGAGLAGFGLTNHEQVEKWVGQVDFAVFGQANAQEPAQNEKQAGSTGKVADDKASGPSGSPAEKAKDKKEGEAQSAVNANDWKDEDVNHFKKLVDRKKELDAREEELNRQEQELQAQREELEKKLKSLDSTRKNISNVLQEKVAEDEKKVATLVDVYSNMKPQQAAKVLETMDEDLAVQILGRMKKKNAAEVLNLMKAEKAQNFSEKFAGYRKN